MEKKRTLTILEILGIAIKSEIDAVKLYEHMKKIVKNEDLAEKFEFLVSQEKKHEETLTEVYNRMFPEIELILPTKSIVPIIDEAIEKNADLKELFEIGMKAEKMAEEFYTDLSKKTNDSNAKSMLVYMAAIERSHFAILEAEFQQLDMKESIKAGEFLDSNRLMTLGP